MRARNLKPGFFKNYQLAQIARPWGRILFEGLWTLADREGRLKDEPEWIRAEIFPYDVEVFAYPNKRLHKNEDSNKRLNKVIQFSPPSIDDMLNLLQGQEENHHPFILRYEVDSHKYIQILNFLKHQSPHIKESESSIPAPDKHQKNTRRARCSTPTEHQMDPPDSLTPHSLTPDSPFSDSLLSSFDVFWKAYPRKIGKGYAKKIFLKVKPNEELLKRMLEKIELFKGTEQWQKDGGQFIPHPATWLNREGWEDEPMKPGIISPQPGLSSWLNKKMEGKND